MNEEYYIFRAAHDGDNGPLIEFIRSGAELTAEHRELIAKLLGGEIQRPPHRQKSIVTEMRRKAIAKRVRALEREMKQMAAIAQVMSEFDCSDKTVKIALQRHRKGEEISTEIKKRADKILDYAKQPDSPQHLLACFTRILYDRINYLKAEVGLKKEWYPPRVFEGD
jgi:hypothetical protein